MAGSPRRPWCRGRWRASAAVAGRAAAARLHSRSLLVRWLGGGPRRGARVLVPSAWVGRARPRRWRRRVGAAPAVASPCERAPGRGDAGSRCSRSATCSRPSSPPAAPEAALREAAAAWPALRPVADACRLGGDVPEALRAARADAGRRAGSVTAGRRLGGLAPHRRRPRRRAPAASPTPYAADQATRRVVAGELASARATARLVAGPPRWSRC